MPDLLREITSCTVCTFYICILVIGIYNVLLKQTIIQKVQEGSQHNNLGDHQHNQGVCLCCVYIMFCIYEHLRMWICIIFQIKQTDLIKAII